MALNCSNALSITGIIFCLLLHDFNFEGRLLNQCPFGPYLAFLCFVNCKAVGIFFWLITSRKYSTSSIDENRSSVPNASTNKTAKPLSGMAFGRPGSNFEASDHNSLSKCLCTQKLKGLGLYSSKYSMRHFFITIYTSRIQQRYRIRLHYTAFYQIQRSKWLLGYQQSRKGY